MKLHIENSIVIENNGRKVTLGEGEYEFDSSSEFIEFIEGLGEQLKQPLIKDEKIRKAVRVWADESGIEKVLSYGDMYWIGFRSTNTASVWKFECNYLDGSKFQIGKEYTIAELCGEEDDEKS